MTSTFNVGTGARAGRAASLSFPGCADLAYVFPAVFILFLNDLPSESL